VDLPIKFNAGKEIQSVTTLQAITDIKYLFFAKQRSYTILNKISYVAVFAKSSDINLIPRTLTKLFYTLI
jgi:hypothetical protein